MSEKIDLKKYLIISEDDFDYLAKGFSNDYEFEISDRVRFKNPKMETLCNDRKHLKNLIKHFEAMDDHEEICLCEIISLLKGETKI